MESPEVEDLDADFSQDIKGDLKTSNCIDTEETKESSPSAIEISPHSQKDSQGDQGEDATSEGFSPLGQIADETQIVRVQSEVVTSSSKKMAP